MTYSPRDRSVIVLESSYAYEGRDSRIDSRIRSMCPRMASAPITSGPCLSSWCGGCSAQRTTARVVRQGDMRSARKPRGGGLPYDAGTSDAASHLHPRGPTPPLPLGAPHG